MPVRFRFIWTLPLLIACNGINQLYTDAALFEQEGMNQAAFEQYRSAYDQKGQAEAMIGMKRNAQALLSRSASEVRMAYMSGDYDQVEPKHRDYLQLRQDLRADFLGIPAETELEGFVVDSRKKMADELVASAQQKLLDGNYEAARTDIRSLQILDRRDARADDLWTLSELVEHYRLGKQAEELGLLDQAYYAYDKVVKIDAGFRDALQLRNDLKEKLSFTLAYLTIPSGEEKNEMEKALSGRITSRILGANSPFIRLVERDNLEAVLQEQLHGMTGMFDEESAVEAGKLVGARYVLSGELINLNIRVMSPEITEQKGFLGKTVRDERVTYLEIRQAYEQQAEFRWQLIDVETGMVHRTGIVPFSDRGELHYAEFEGDSERLYPGQWTLPIGRVPVHWVGYPNDKVYTDKASKDSLDALFKESNRLPDKESMKAHILDLIAEEVAAEVIAFRPPYH